MTGDVRSLRFRRVPSDAGRSAGPAATPGRGWWSARLLWLVPGLAIAVYASVLAGDHGVGLLALLAFGIVPHLPILLAVGQPHARGQMPVRAVPLFNVLHHPVPPLLVLGLAAAGLLSPFWLVGGLAWLSHLVTDQAFGHGLRSADGWRRPWWALR